MENNNQIKLSQLVGQKKLQFINGVSTWINPLDTMNGDIIFNSVDISNKTMVELSQKVADGIMTGQEYLYHIIPILTNVIVDISEEEFEKYSKSPSPQFGAFSSGLSMLMADIMKTNETLLESKAVMDEQIKLAESRLPKKTDLEQKQEALDFLAKAYKVEKDTKVKHDLFVKKAILKAEIEELKENKLNDVLDK